MPNRLLALSLQFSPLVGSGSTWSDNLVAIAINAGAAVYILSILRKDWAANPAGSSLVEARRLYRYLWVLYGLGITVFGVQQVLQYIFLALSNVVGVGGFLLADGLALLLAPSAALERRFLRPDDQDIPAFYSFFLQSRQQTFLAKILRLYIDSRSLCKLELGLAKGKQLHDRRHDIAARDAKRDIARELADAPRGR